MFKRKTKQNKKRNRLCGLIFWFTRCDVHVWFLKNYQSNVLLKLDLQISFDEYVKESTAKTPPTGCYFCQNTSFFKVDELHARSNANPGNRRKKWDGDISFIPQPIDHTDLNLTVLNQMCFLLFVDVKF